ncbi:hypothetical protein LTR37_003505 [Vermiconidia calcicola]|uniref:Uncharacterized protein n=1 Tax=Vermiconidia calcicola TaxID=1690605 RepID=A0ACC3NPS3_9PEZI|nr:hypothetical protein LTR37_003505 [Vermiconidia calcicola]
MAAPSPKVKVAIVGGGIAGLALAAGLHRKHEHIDWHLYEAVSEYKDVGAGLAIHLNGIKAMTLIGPEVRQAYFDNASDMGEEDQEMSTEVILAQGPSMGELVAELGKAKGRKSISRADLLQGLAKLIPRDCISFDKNYRVLRKTAKFQDGTEARADCLIGADGVHSVTRRYILGPEHPATEPKNHDGWQIYRTMVSMEDARKHIDERWTKIVPILLGPRGHINCMPLNNGTRLSAGVAVRGAKFTDSGAAPDLDPELDADYREDARQLAKLVAKDTSASWTAADHDHAPTYFRGHVAMMGDSAHASLPFAGNGAAQSLEDAAVFDHLFSRLDSPQQVEAALSAYDLTRRPRSQAVVDIARKYGRVYAYVEGDLHKDPIKMKKFFAESAAFTNHADLDKQNNDAMELFVEALKGQA